jgi:Lon-like ATP-dependent protease
LVNGHYSFDKIVSIKKVPYDGYVYNLTTETGNYLVNGVLTHNSGGLGTPAHLRVEPGMIHRANKGVLFIDEVSTISQKSQQELLSAMQEKKYPITGQSEMSSGAMVRTDPVPCEFLLIASGNLFDLEKMHPALRSRIRGYGYELYLNEFIEDTPSNRKKLEQFVAQEVVKDGKIPHFTKEAVDEVIFEAKRRAGSKGKFTLRLRDLGGLVRAAGDIAVTKNAKIVTREHVLEAKKLARTLEQQVADKQILQKKEYEVFVTRGYRVGKVNGLAVMGTERGHMGGILLPIEAQVATALSLREGKIIATGKLGEIAKEAVQNVSAIIKKYKGTDISNYDTHIQFLQTYEGVEGDSASVSVATAVISALENIPVDLSVAMTGSLSVKGEVLPVGGVTAKIEAAIEAGVKKVIIPRANRDDVTLEKEKLKKIRIVTADNLSDVLANALKDGKEKQKLIKNIAQIIV